MQMCRPGVAAIVAACAALSIPAPARAQAATNSGQIVGQITDTSGAAIVGAQITARSEDTNLVRRAASDSAGRYAVPLLPPGAYDLTVEAAGLETARQSVVVRTGASLGRASRCASPGSPSAWKYRSRRSTPPGRRPGRS
jgi:hypothetical protein